MNSIFGIKNIEFIIGFKKMTKLVRLATWEAHWLSLWTTAFGKVQWPALLQRPSSQENGSGNKSWKEINRRIGELAIGGYRCILAVVEEGGAEQEERKKKWGKGEKEGRRLFMRQWPSLWTTTFGLSMAVIHNVGHWQFFKINSRHCERRSLTS